MGAGRGKANNPYFKKTGQSWVGVVYLKADHTSPFQLMWHDPISHLP